MFLVYRFFIIIIKKEIFTWILFLPLVTVTDLTLVRLALITKTCPCPYTAIFYGSKNEKYIVLIIFFFLLKT